jgi:SAM-dependent methyltransferase
MNLKSFKLRNLVYRGRQLLERVRGVDFLTVIEPEDVGLDSKCVFRSSPSGNKYLTNVLNKLNISSKDTIIDVGCGKGSAMRTMLKYPFARVDGIELSEHIATIAMQNFKTLNEVRSKVFNCDATTFSDYDAYNIVYFYNPFPPVVMLKVIETLIQSVHRSERELVIIYNNPTCHDVIVDKGIFSKVGDYPDEWGNRIFIYSNRRDSNSRFHSNRSIN